MRIKKQSKGKVYVGMSGGVDSSVSAALLQKEGYEIVGVFMKVWQPDFLACTWEDERRDAMRVAAHLGIPLLTWDFENEYKKEVADYMIREYKEGRTPNPDVMCNKEIKFGVFFRRAIKEGADYVATGHYAQIAFDKKNNVYKMLAGVDLGKDQSYFLWTIGQEQLSRTFFPVGGFKKTHVRDLAKKFKLPVADKKDSQGLCFMGKLDMKDFLRHYVQEKEGEVLDDKGNIVGTHRGALFYTLGERHGFTITKKTTEERPYYVVAKDLESNTITVVHDVEIFDDKAQNIQLISVNFCRGISFDTKRKLTAQIRYHGEHNVCEIQKKDNGTFELHFDNPVLVARGQSIVLYDKGECIGGGIVK